MSKIGDDPVSWFCNTLAILFCAIAILSFVVGLVLFTQRHILTFIFIVMMPGFFLFGMAFFLFLKWLFKRVEGKE